MWNGGEGILPSERARIEEAFSVRLHNLYGAREVGAVAFESDDGLEVTRDLLVEVVDHDNRPVNEGEQGRILVTSLANPFSPILRYEIGDIATARKKRSGPFQSKIGEVLGRKSGTIPLGDKREISALSFDHLLKDYPVREFSVSFNKSSVHVFLQVDHPDLVDRVRREVQPLVGHLVSPLDVSLFVSTLPVPRSKSGKLEHVWSQSEGGA